MKNLSTADLLEIMTTYQAAIADYRREIAAAYEEIEARVGYGKALPAASEGLYAVVR